MPNTVLITGTSSGYGKATAELFLERGWNVLATMRRPDPALFAASSGRLKVLPLEVTDAKGMEKVDRRKAVAAERAGAAARWS